MAPKAPEAEKALAKLQNAVRSAPAQRAGDLTPPMKIAHVPSGVGAERRQDLCISGTSLEALADAQEIIGEDLRFEHMGERELDEAMWRFTCLAYFRRTEDHVGDFVRDHAQEPEELTCYFPVELLRASTEREIFAGVRLLPPEVVDLPQMVTPDLQPKVDAVACSECRGTDRRKMAPRARELVEHALRVLRVALREHKPVPDQQLRFRLGTMHWFSGGGGGWARRDDDGFPLELVDEMFQLAAAAPIASLPATPTNDIERAANRALEWLEDAQLATEPVIALLYSFFALEAILGRKSDKEKAKPLAVRRAVLGHATTGHFSSPARIFALYDEVRSAAVHGEAPPPFHENDFVAFKWDARRALNEFLDFARAQDASKRGPVLDALEADPARDEIVERFFPKTAQGQNT